MLKQRAASSERGMALVTTLMTMLLVSTMGLGLLMTTTTDVQITSNEVSNNAAFYVAEAGINVGTAWFAARFSNNPNTAGLYLLPGQNTGTSPSSTSLNFTVPPAAPSYSQGFSASTYPEAALLTSVKIGSGGNLENLTLTDSNSTTTYPSSYTVTANNNTGATTTFTYNNVVTDFRNNLVNQTVGSGSFTVKAVLVNFNPPASGSSSPGTMTWLLKAAGTSGGATANLVATISSSLYPISSTTTGTASTTQTVNLAGGVISRGVITLQGSSFIDSYKSSKGAYGAALAANTYSGQRGAFNEGSNGFARSNGEGTNGFITSSGTATVYGGVAETLPASVNPIQFPSYFTPSQLPTELFSQPTLTFPAVATVPAPPTGSTNYSISGGSVTVPSGDHGNINAQGSGTLTVPPNTYNNLTASGGGILVLGVAGQVSTYNFQNINITGGGKIQFNGPCIINIQNNYANSNDPGVVTGLKPGDLQFNVVGGPSSTVSASGAGVKIGVFYCPNSDFSLLNSGTLYGSVTARSVTLSGNAFIHADEDVVSGVQQTQTVSGTTSVTTVTGYSGGPFSLVSMKQTFN